MTNARHAALIVGEECAPNFVFRGGPCDVCGGACLCRPDEELVERLLGGGKPVGTFAYRRKCEADRMRLSLEALGLACWSGRNRWKAHVLVAALRPDKPVGAWGTPREVAFAQKFIDERVSFVVAGAMYGYRSAFGGDGPSAERFDCGKEG